MNTVSDVVKYLEQIAPPALQESYDNSRLIYGDATRELTGVIVSLDALESVVDEAIAANANLVVSHHPIVFSGLKSLTGATYIERTIIKAIKHDIALYACHTNLDNVIHAGVNEKIGQAIGLENLQPLSPNRSLTQYDLHVSELLQPNLKKALVEVLAYEMESFGVTLDDSNGLRVTGPSFLSKKVRAACDKFNVVMTSSEIQTSAEMHIGAGAKGSLPLPMTENDFLTHLKDVFKLKVIRHTALLNKSIQSVAVCGGSGSFLLRHAIAAKADVFITADYKYHQFFDADNQILITDIGHFESEQYTINLLADLINGKFSTFAARCTEVETNPVRYFT